MNEFEFDFGEATLRGKTVLVSGGSGGLGSAAVALLAREGADVVCGFRGDAERAGRLRDAVQERFGRDIRLVQADICTSEGRTRLVEAAEDGAEGIYGLVCCSGDPGRVKFDQASQDDLHDSMTKNYYAPLLLARQAAARMQARSLSGAIVLFSTMQATAPFESSINYAGPKTALQQAARILAKQWGGPGGIRVNAIAPGVNRAGMALASIRSGKYDFFLEKKVIPRFGRPEDTARLVRLLLEPDGYITGQVITVDGGLTLRRDRG